MPTYPTAKICLNGDLVSTRRLTITLKRAGQSNNARVARTATAAVEGR